MPVTNKPEEINKVDTNLQEPTQGLGGQVSGQTGVGGKPADTEEQPDPSQDDGTGPEDGSETADTKEENKEEIKETPEDTPAGKTVDVNSVEQETVTMSEGTHVSEDPDLASALELVKYPSLAVIIDAVIARVENLNDESITKMVASLNEAKGHLYSYFMSNNQ